MGRIEMSNTTVGENYFSEFESDEIRNLAAQYSRGKARNDALPQTGSGIKNWNKKSNKSYFLTKLEEKAKEKQIQEVLEIEIWNLKKFIATKISELLHLQMIKKVGSGVDGMVFLCSAEGIGEVALKLIMNQGVITREIKKSFGNEYKVLEAIPIHKNIIPILGKFQSRPSDLFFDEYPPDLKPLAVHVDGTRRMSLCILMPSMRCFGQYFTEEFRKKTIGISQKLEFISDILEGLVFLFEHGVVHLDMKLNNLLINSSGRVIICDFGCSKFLDQQKKAFIPRFGMGGNAEHLAPEIKAVDTSQEQWVDFSKQPSFELGMLAHEIIFGRTPEGVFGEEMDDDYFGSLCPDNSHKIPQLFRWMEDLLMQDKERRIGLEEGRRLYEQILEEQRLNDFIQACQEVAKVANQSALK